ncbi:FAR1 DNA-binding domain containing protein [Entamoeba nuttalli P19]|uniref:FAR1 DNA-binding domain containing protein n=1 Tax=Entamoeba nuttalli (strain P19) TaxID=1076696 RepID=K2H4I3_ENTNP|nr:FAR1 DNA-binding domain containing protein [Entamoeba nuttalli P19]EKE41207.1 FAR1 DNA-binding domain containing protein [Entamoeba nuttalli P19]|eukprot:XP_008856460.1 FAR1 DNA-binding domain containing protein [Entamoeba nuttalli P19]
MFPLIDTTNQHYSPFNQRKTQFNKQPIRYTHFSPISSEHQYESMLEPNLNDVVQPQTCHFRPITMDSPHQLSISQNTQIQLPNEETMSCCISSRLGSIQLPVFNQTYNYSSEIDHVTNTSSQQHSLPFQDQEMSEIKIERQDTPNLNETSLQPTLPSKLYTTKRTSISPMIERTLFSPINTTTFSTKPISTLGCPRPFSATGEVVLQPIHRSMFSPITLPNQNEILHGSRPQSVPGNYNQSELTVPKDLDVKRYTKYEGKNEFQSYEEAMKLLTEWAEGCGVVLRKGSGNNKSMKDGTKKKVVLVCQCSGKYRSCSGSPTEEVCCQTKGIKKRRSKKTECPFRINLNYRTKTRTWNITKMILEHNHM